VRLPSSIADLLEPWWEARVSDARNAPATTARKRAAPRTSRDDAGS
jgi:hypothetical protein